MAASEIKVKVGQTIVTKTDLHGVIVYANADFCQISGYSEAELIGKPHNLIRHPDMPSEVFADFWVTLKKGLPWNGIVKNRSKNGDYYWVNAFVAPIHEKQVIIGYLSSRIKATDEQIAFAETLYQEMRSGKCQYKVKHGLVISKSIFRQLNPLWHITHAPILSQFSNMLFVFITGILICCLLASNVLDKIKIKGDIYQNIIQGKDLVADILPPPVYLVETWLTTLEMIEDDGTALPTLIKRGQTLRQEYEQRLAYWQDHLKDGQLKKLLEEDSKILAMKFLDLRDKELIPALLAHDREKITSLLPKLRTLYEGHRQVIDQLVKLINERNQSDEILAEEILQQSMLGLLLLALSLVAFVIVIGFYIKHRVSKKLGGEPDYATNIAHHIAAGNLGVYVNNQSDEHSLLAAMGEMQTNLQQTLVRIQSDAKAVAGIATRLATESDQLKHMASNQSDFAVNIASSTESMLKNILQVAENAEQAKGMSLESEQVCLRGASIIKEAISGMQTIAGTVNSTSSAVVNLATQSDQIASVVRVIHEIADQTNLLALNAAIEAARAGEYGRGFAVVADEVRNLAKRTALATGEITEVISHIQTGMRQAASAMETGVQQVNYGLSLAAEAGTAIQQIQDSSEYVVNSVSSISLAMHQQSQTSQIMTENIDKITITANQNSSAATKSALAAKELEQAASNLANAINRFAV